MADTITIREKKLGRFGQRGRKGWHGYFDPNTNTIYLDPRLKPGKHLEIVIHEVLHYLFPKFSETRVKYAARILAGILWALQYRRISQS